MGLFDEIKRMAGSALKKEANKAIRNAVTDAKDAIGKGRNHTESFTFERLPTSVAELEALPEAKLDSAFKTAALTMAVLCNYEKDPAATFEMLDFLKGPGDVSGFERQFITEHMGNAPYKARSYFAGATPENGYVPTEPYTITVIENPYSFDNENWATLYVKSGGGDNPRPIKLRCKPSTKQWFLNEIQCLGDIRVPVSEDPWA